MVATTGTRLTRGIGGARPAAPVRMVHLGLGNFFRAHQAWYTDHTPDRDAWGIAAFSGRSPDLARSLQAQDGLYTLAALGPDGPAVEVVSSLSACLPATDHPAFLRLLGDARVQVLTLTVTESGYRRGRDGSLDTADPAVAGDLEKLRRSPCSPVSTVPARVLAGLAARRAAGAGPCTVLSCDNVDGNGQVLARVVRDAAGAVAPSLASWIEEHVAFPSSVVDRITPRPVESDLETVRAATGVPDPAAVVTEPYSEWILQDGFRAERPRWEDAGARFVPDVTAYERRKLLMLNGAHSLLAYLAPLRGHTTVAGAIADPVVRGRVEDWWDLARRHVPLTDDELARYRAELADRFANTGIRHLLSQIATDGSQKLPVRVLPVLRAEREAGRLPLAAVRTLAAWLLSLRAGEIADPMAGELTDVARGPLPDAAVRVLGLLDPDLAADRVVAAAVANEAWTLQG